MPFKKPPHQPGFADLITSLNNSRNQIKDNALYQTIYLLVQRMTLSRDMIQKEINDVEETIHEVQNVSILTADDETVQFANSRRLLAGLNILFDDTVYGERTISSTGSGGLSGGATGYWTPLTDGLDPTSLIFAGEEAIAVNVPNNAPYRP